MNITGYSKVIACASMWLLCTSAGASSLIVTTLGDSGTGSLRDQLDIANASAGENIIEFQQGLTGTIALESALPIILEDLQILGPGPGAIAISGEQAYRIFEIDDDVAVTISGLTLLEGRASGALGLGGCVWNKGSLLLADTVIKGCRAEVAGGGIANDGDLVMRRSTVQGNTASPEEFAAGGGIDNFGSARIEQSTISGNIAAGDGGGIANGPNAELTLMNTTISGNSADFGGGLLNFEGALSIQFSTIANNSADFGGGIFNEGQVEIRNSLIANNALGADCDNQNGFSFEVSGVNLNSDGSCPGQQSTSAQIALRPLADNGGPTQTHALGADSVALAAATECTELDGTTPVESDQRGIPRPQGDACDVGAFEREPGDDEPVDVIFADRFEVP